MNLYQQTFKLIQERPARVSLQEIAKATKLNYSWVCKFQSGDITNPTYNNLQKLHDYLIKLK